MANCLQANSDIWARALCATAIRVPSEIGSEGLQTTYKGRLLHAKLPAWVAELPAEAVPTLLATAEPSITTQLNVAPDHLHDRILRHHMSHPGGVPHLSVPAAALTTATAVMARVASGVHSLAIVDDQALQEATAHTPDTLAVFTNLESVTLQKLQPRLAQTCLSVAKLLPSLTQLQFHRHVNKPIKTESNILVDIATMSRLRSLRLSGLQISGQHLRALTALTALAIPVNLGISALAQLGDALAGLPLASLELYGKFLGVNSPEALWPAVSQLPLVHLDILQVCWFPAGVL